MTAPTPQPGILEIAPYVGGESKAAGVSDVLRLAANENPFGPSPAAIEAYKAGADSLHRYPEGGSTVLREAIAEVHGLDPAQLVCGAGSDELISLLINAYAGPGDEVLHSAHGFLMYSISALAAGAAPVAAPESNLTADVDALLANVTPRTKLVFLANPNNPTGTMLSESELRRLRAGLPDHVILAVDAAYAEYVEAEDYDDGAALVRDFDNVVMLRTFSKVHGLAALRLGWMYGPEGIIDVMNRVRGPFNVSVPAQAAGAAAIRDTGWVETCRTANSRVREIFRGELGKLGVPALPSHGNFILAGFADAPAMQDSLRAKGILVRQMGGYGLPGHLRITIAGEDDMSRVVKAIEELL